MSSATFGSMRKHHSNVANRKSGEQSIHVEDDPHGATKAPPRSKLLLANLGWLSVFGYLLLIPMTLKHELYEKHTLIAAVQAVVLYTILHIQEAGSIPKHCLKSIIITLGVCSCLHTCVNCYW